ncbi:hypothetical protein EV182_002006 [Spiromyces aspiralis]|uniref:Uncharacterized protein n=1 Tax=Spiromyces aspiralis TaxID=68401 RepID=A0ACC1HUP0_9FUNG|nr:hypothetical protein EV182_002006 [Spiromyces aspiralis]
MSPSVTVSSDSSPKRSSSPETIISGASLVKSPEERKQLHLTGLIPGGISTLGLEESLALEQLRQKETPLQKYIYLACLRNATPDIFYNLVAHHLKEIAPIIYTPTVGKACQEFSHIYPSIAPLNHPDGLYVSLNQVDNIDEIIQNYRHSAVSPDDPQITVITDGSRILGLGDLGMNGMGIPIGKLQLYVVAGGLDPRRCLPIVLDFGTDNQKYLDDPHYLGLRQKRPDDNVFYAACEKVISALHRAWPGMFIQFEDFSTEHAFGLLELWRNRVQSFNDDIQGTGSVILSGFIRAVELAGIDPLKQRILFVGAGSAGVGVAKQLVDYFVIEHGIPEDQAKRMFWLVDSRGLITANRGDKLAPHKVYFARDDNDDTQCPDLSSTVDYVRPTALIGLSTIYKAFNDEILAKMDQINQHNRPIIFPLSNPETKAECTFEEAMKATNERVLFASGTAFPNYTTKSGEVRVPGQGNNMYVFPGIGLGAVLARPAKITDTMIFAASKALANSVNDDEIKAGDLYPRIERIREVSARVAAAIIHQAVSEGLVEDKEYIDTVGPIEANKKPDGSFSQATLKKVQDNMWSPPDSHISYSQVKL